MPCNELIWHRYVNFICVCNLVVLLTTFVQSSPVLFCIDNTIIIIFLVKTISKLLEAEMCSTTNFNIRHQDAQLQPTCNLLYPKLHFFHTSV